MMITRKMCLERWVIDNISKRQRRINKINKLCYKWSKDENTK